MFVLPRFKNRSRHCADRKLPMKNPLFKLALGGVLLFSGGVQAGDDIAALKQQMKQLLAQVEMLAGKLNALEKSTIAQSEATLSAKVEETAERVEELESSMDSVDERIGDKAVATAFDGLQLDIGGFIHTAYTSINGENGTESSFDRQNFELLIGAKIDKDWSAFFAGGFLRESDPSITLDNRRDPVFNSRNKNPQIIAWVNYENSNLFNVRVGRMITPHGVINVEHFPATLLDPEQPQFLRPFSGETIFPNFSTGVQLHGKSFQDDWSFEYATYATNAAANADDGHFGGRMAFGLNSDALIVGINLATGTRVEETDYDMFGLDLKYVDGNFSLKSEYYTTNEDEFSGLNVDREAYYIQPAYNISPQWVGFARYDFLDMGEFRGESTEWALGLNYLMSSNVRLRAIYTLKDFEKGVQADADADMFQVSGTFSF